MNCARLEKAYLQKVEGRRVEEEKRDKIEDPDQLMHSRLPSEVPQRRAIIPMVDEVYYCQYCQGKADSCKNNPKCTRPNQLLS